MVMGDKQGFIQDYSFEGGFRRERSRGCSANEGIVHRLE